MTATRDQTSNHLLFESRLRRQKDPLQRLLLIDKLAGHYAYTNIKRARALLEEQHVLLNQFDYPDFRLNYYLIKATIENNCYSFQEAEINFLQAIQMLEERGDAMQQAETYIDYAGACMNLDKMPDAEVYLEKASKLLKTFPNDRLIPRLICREGFMNLHYANFTKATELLLEAKKAISALTSSLGLKDYYFLALIYSGLGKVYEKTDELDKSVKAFKQVVAMCERQRMRTRIAWHYLNVGNALMSIGDEVAAESFFLRSIESPEDTSEPAKASAYANLGYCYFLKGEHDTAHELYNKAERLLKSKGDIDYYNFSIIATFKARLFAEQGDGPHALEYFSLAFEYAQFARDYKQLSSICKEMASLYAEQEDFQNAYEYQLLYDSMLEQYQEQVNKRKQMELEFKYEAEKKKQEAELLRLQATKLQLKALRAQMNPHFMYNALNSIQNYITSNETASAAKYLAKFAKLMRQSLEYSDLEIISLEKEIEFLEDYLYINEKLRFENRLSYEIIVEDEIEEDILGVPTMIIQPYVENAIEHGLKSKKEGFVKISFHLFDENTILCTIEDNGIGRKKAKQLQMNDPKFQNHRSRGTNITEERLKILHSETPSGWFVKTVDLMDSELGSPAGTKVEIRIPIIDLQIKSENRM